MKPLIYLELRQLANSIKNLARSPKRLIPAVIIGAWLISAVIQNLLIASGLSQPMMPSVHTLRALPVDAMWSGIFLLLSVTSGLVIYSALSEGLLVFAPSHIDFLFPTPINRRNVLAFKLLRDYVKYAVLAAIFFMALGSPLYGSLRIPPYPTIILSWLGSFFLIVFVMNVTHTLNIVGTFGAHRLRFASRLVKFGMLGIAGIIIAAAAVHFSRTGQAFPSFIAATRNGLATVLLSPIAWCTDLILAPITGVVYETWGELLWLFVLASGSTVVLLSRPENIYEPSLGISMRMARVRAAMRVGDVVTARIQAGGWRGRHTYLAPPIPPFGRGASALLWKNLVVRIRTLRWGVAMILVLPLGAAAAAALVNQTIILRLAPLAIPYCVWLLALTSQQEMRGELRQANIVKAMPVSSFRIIAAEVFYHWLMILVVVLVAALSIWLFIPQTDPDMLSLTVVISLALGFTCVAAVSIPVLLYPDSRDKMQEVITHLVSFVLASIVILPSLLVAVAFVLLRANLALTACVVVALNGALAWSALAIAGALFGRFDPTAD